MNVCLLPIHLHLVISLISPPASVFGFFCPFSCSRNGFVWLFSLFQTLFFVSFSASRKTLKYTLINISWESVSLWKLILIHYCSHCNLNHSMQHVFVQNSNWPVFNCKNSYLLLMQTHFVKLTRWSHSIWMVYIIQIFEHSICLLEWYIHSIWGTYSVQEVNCHLNKKTI